MRYPLTLRPDQNGTIIAQAVDVPGALTLGNDEADAIEQAADALITLFAYFIAEGEPIPQTSRPRPGNPAPSCRRWSRPSSRFTRLCVARA